jgi:hypothetical protein
MSSDVMEFGFEDTKVIKPQGMEQLKLTRPGERAAMSIISFKDYHSAAMMKKTREKGSPLDEEEKANIFKLVDEKLAEKLGKSVSDLTEIDRLDYQSPRFWVSFTHYRDGLGTIKCLSKYEGSQIVKPEICCDEIGEASQTIGTIVLKYPTDKDGNVDLDLLKMKKQTEVEWLIERLNKLGFAQVVTDEEIKQAKEMEKDQMLEVSKVGCFSTFEFEQYYKETYEHE